MTFDPAARFTNALNHSATSLVDAHQMLRAAIEDVRAARTDPNLDPAVRLLAIHCGRISSQHPSPITPQEQQLRLTCQNMLSEMRAKPLLALVCAGNIWFRPEAKSCFIREGRRALIALAAQLSLRDIDYRLTHFKGWETESGSILLLADKFRLYLRASHILTDTELQYRRISHPFDDHNDTNHPNFYASISQLLEPDILAPKIRIDLNLPSATTEQRRLFA